MTPFETPKEINQNIHQVIWDNHRWCSDVLGRDSPLPCVFEDFHVILINAEFQDTWFHLSH